MATSRGENNDLVRQLVVLTKKLGGIAALLNKITDASKLQQESLQVNKTLSEVIGTHSEVFQTTIGGFNVALKSQTAFLKEGFTQVNVGQLELAGSLNVTNQSVQSLVRMNTKLLSQGQASEKEISALNRSILDSSIQNGIAASKLIDAITSLDSTYTGILGISAKVAEATNLLVAQYGVQVGPQIAKLVSALTNPADIGRLVQTDLFDIATKLQSGKLSPAEQAREFGKAIERLSRRTTQLSQGGPVGLNIAKSLVGEMGELASQIANNNSLLTVRDKVENKLIESLNALWKQAIVPLEIVAQKLLNGLIIGIKFTLNSAIAMVSLSALIGAFLLPALGALIVSLGVLTGGLSLIGAVIGGIAGGFLFSGINDINKQVASMGKDLKEMNSREERKEQADRFKNIGESSRFAFLSSETIRNAIDRVIFQNNNDMKELVRIARTQLGVTGDQLLQLKLNADNDAAPILSLGT